MQDIWADIRVIHNRSPERLGYPTQKPESLLERIILASNNPGDLVMDVFAGSGTTAAVAEKLGRRWVVCDFGKHAIYTIQKRICQIADSQKLLEQNPKKKEKYGKPPRPFCVASVGAFDFAKIMGLRENREAYIRFVLGIFGISEWDDSLAKTWRVSHVCALKDSHPVEVYPVWDDDYLKHIRIDDNYLQGIWEQSGGRLKGTYYIIAPETCVTVGNTTRKNAAGEPLHFHMLTFPYKVLEDAARNFAIEEQPNSAANINRLISSVGFYFHDAVKIRAKKTKTGFTITRFETRILNRDGSKYSGLEGLSMILIDTRYDEAAGFMVNAVVYQKDIRDHSIMVKDISNQTAVIAIDRHGNESPVTMIQSK